MLNTAKSIFAKAKPKARTPKVSLAITEILSLARDKIAKPYGWTKNTLHRTVKRNEEQVDAYCMLGALDAACGSSIGSTYSARRVLERAISNLYGKGFPSVPYFNDRPETKKRDVLKVFDEAIELSKKKNSGG